MRSFPGQVTLQQVANAAGVSLKTASRVLNHEFHVKPAKEIAVRAAIKRLGYQPNELARSLVSRQSGIVGVVVPFLSHYFVAGCVQAIHHAAQEHGITIMLTISDGDPAAEANHIRTLLRRQVEGLIIFPTTNSLESTSAFDLKHTPVVVVDQPTRIAKTDSIMVANQEAAQAVANHLIHHGYQTIAVLGVNRRLHTIAERVAGYRRAMRAAGLKTRELVPAKEEELSLPVIRNLFTPRSQAPRAVFTLNSFASIKTLHAIRQCGLCVPEDVALFGFDDFDTADSLQPSISVVSQPIEEIGKNAVEFLIKRIRGTRFRTEQKIILAAHLTVRASCGCPENLL